MSNPKIIDLGWSVARINRENNQPILEITQPMNCHESGLFQPAQTVGICGEFNIEALRDFLSSHHPDQKLKKLRMENARLREALTEIERIGELSAANYGSACGHRVSEIAQKALEGEGK